MDERFSRTARLFGEEGLEKLSRCRVAVFGLGGVGGYAVEALARSGIGALDLIDHDTVDVTNLNRQILALEETVGREKTEVAKERVLSINPNCRVTPHPVFYLPETADQFDFTAYDYVVDAIDTVAGKIAIIENALKAGTPVISSMGTGNKQDPSRLEIADLSKTTICPLARVMRRELKKRGILHVPVVYSKEEPMTPGKPQETAVFGVTEADLTGRRKDTPGSTPFVPGAAGLLLASRVVSDLLNPDHIPKGSK